VKACTSRTDTLLTVNFHRKTLGQTGIGHYSPLAGFNANKDMVLILDVAKFKYGSYWCRLETLYESFKALDLYSDLSRGYLINRKVVNLNDHLVTPFHNSLDHKINLSIHEESTLQLSYQKISYLLRHK
jgi:ATP sulfurylase